MQTEVPDHTAVVEFFANDYCTGYKTTDDSGMLAQFQARNEWGIAEYTFNNHDDEGVRCDDGYGCELMSLRFYYMNDGTDADTIPGYGFKINMWPNFDYNTGQAYPYQQFYCDDVYIDDSIPACANAVGGFECGQSITGNNE